MRWIADGGQGERRTERRSVQGKEEKQDALIVLGAASGSTVSIQRKKRAVVKHEPRSGSESESGAPLTALGALEALDAHADD